MGGYLTIRNDKMLLPSEGNCHMFFSETHLEVRQQNYVLNIWKFKILIFDAIILFGKNILVCETMMHDMREQNNTSLIHKICPCCVWSCNSSVQRNVVPKSTDVHHLFSVLCVALPLCRMVQVWFRWWNAEVLWPNASVQCRWVWNFSIWRRN